MPVGERPTLATIAVYLVTVTGIGTLALAFGFLALGAALVGGATFLALLLLFLLGAIYTYGGWALRRDESWGWGAGVFGGVLYLAVGLFLTVLALPFMAIAAVVIVLLYQSREYYGMIRADPDEEDRRRAEVEARRTANPGKVPCPKCGSLRMWIASDGSAFCMECKAGTISVRPV